MPLLVKDIMSSPALTVDWNKSVKEAAKYLKKIRRGFLVVTRRGKPVGVVSDKDFIYKVVAQDKRASKLKIKDIMTKHFVYATPDENVVDVARRMLRNNVHRLPVIANGKVVGVISLTDIARASPEMVDLLERRLQMKEEPIVIKEKYTSGICDLCGNYSDRLEYINGQWICEDCKESLGIE